MESLKVHPTATIFPEMSGAQFADLVADIKQNGLVEPVLLHPDGSIIDGRNRYRACLEAGVEPKFRTWDGHGSEITLVLSLNLHRRHLDESQRAMVGARLKPLFEPGGKDRQLATLKQNSTVVANLPPRDGAGKSREKAAALVNVSPRLIDVADKVVNEGSPELVSAVNRGELSVSAARDLAELPAKEQRAVLAKGQKQVRAKLLEIRRGRQQRAAEKKGQPASGQGRYASAEEILSSRLVELIADYEKRSPELVAGIEIDRDFEGGPVASIRIIHESGAATKAC